MTGSARPDQVVLGGVSIDLLSHDELSSAVDDRLRTPQPALPLAVVSANLDHIHHFGGGRDGLRSHDELEWLVALDGSPLVRRASELTGRPEAKLSGSDLLPHMLDIAAAAGATVGFLGGTEESHQRLDEAISANGNGPKVTGWWSPPRTVIEDAAQSDVVAGQIRAAGVDMLVVGLGKPRQENWIAQHGYATGARVLLAFGAAADFIAGTATRAPTWVQDAGAEWAYRLAREPRRLANRYIVQGPRALWQLRTNSHVVSPDEDAAP